MVLSERGLRDMTKMEMPLPDNTATMMTGTGPFGAMGIGGMFSRRRCSPSAIVR